MNEGHHVIPTFSMNWWVATLVCTAIIIGLLIYLKRIPDDHRRKWEYLFSAIVFLVILNTQFVEGYQGTWHAGKSLPLHLCGISKVVGGILLIRFNQRWFEFALLLGMGGAIQAFLTPQITLGGSAWAHIEYYISHGSIVFIPLYLFYVLGHRLTKKAWLRSFLLGLLILGIVGFLNYLTGGNYIYLCEKPLADNPLLIGEWPTYLTGFLVFGFINIVLFHLLFRWWGKRLDRNT